MTTAAKIVDSMARYHGVILTAETAEAIADAVLNYHDDTFQVRSMLPREAWEDRPCRESHIQHVRRRIVDELIDKGRIPVALPIVTVRYLDYRYYPLESGVDPREEVPADLAESGRAEYQSVDITLTIPCRTPKDPQ